MIYLDNSATTQPCPEAIEAVELLLNECWGNPSSIHRLGQRAHERLESARIDVAAALGAERNCIYFTSGGTEADNWAIMGAAEKLGRRGKHMITTAFEHHAVLHPMQKLASLGFEITYLQPDAHGMISLSDFQAAIRPDTIFASIMMVNNELGSVMPIAEMARALHRIRPEALFHTDAVQGLFKVPFSARSLGADLISVSAHKIHGMKGAGALYIRQGLQLPPLLLGGGQEHDKRSGTEPLPAICAFGAAASALRKTAQQDMQTMTSLRETFTQRLCEVPGAVLLGSGSHIVSLSLPGLRSQILINELQDRDIYVSAGSACSKGHRSHVLQSIRADNASIDGAIRVSFSRTNTMQDVDALLNALKDCSARLK